MNDDNERYNNQKNTDASSSYGHYCIDFCAQCIYTTYHLQADKQYKVTSTLHVIHVIADNLYRKITD